MIDALDVVVASPHSALDQDAETAIERLVCAVENPAVDILGHLSGRLLNERSGLEFDATASHGPRPTTTPPWRSTATRDDSISGQRRPGRTEEGAPIAVNTDAHQPSTLEYLRWGVHTARRGWAEPADVINTWELEELRAFLE